MPEATQSTVDVKESGKTFNEAQDLDKKELDYFKFVKDRIQELQKTRENHYGHNLDTIWANADKDYIPHRLRAEGTKAIVTDEEKGWRGAVVTMGSSDWQSDISQSNPFVKIQTALAILIDQNPAGVFTPMLKKFQATTELIKQLYQRSWEIAKSRAQLKLFVFNLSKYGWAIARTYPLKIERNVRVMKNYNPDKPEESKYDEEKVVEYNDIFRENLDPRNAWIDDMAKPNNPRSVKDWTWRKIYDIDTLKEEFGKYKLFEKATNASGNTEETINKVAGSSNTGSAVTKEYQSKGKHEVYFYENRAKDMFWVLINGVPVIREALPIADAKGNKKLSLWQTYWNLRHAESPYGIGIYEAIRFDQAMLDRVRNMTIDQLTLSIYKMFFYQGTQQLQNTGEIDIRPGVGKQVLDPKNISWLQVPGPGNEAWQGISLLKNDIDEGSGITPTLIGEVTGKTAFETAQAKESALKRLKNPLDNILEALNEEGYITIALCQLLYSIPETIEITDPKLIDDYLKEIENDPELFDREDIVDEKGEPTGNTKFIAKVFPEFPLNLDKDDKGNLTNTKETKFFRIKPSFLNWEGIVNIKSQSILAPSQQVEKALGLEFYNMLIPLLSQLGQERLMLMQLAQGQPVLFDDLPHGKTIKELCKLYDKDPRDILPDSWLNAGEAPVQDAGVAQAPAPEEPLFINAQGAGAAPLPPIAADAPQPEADKFIATPTQTSERPQGIVGKMMSKLRGIGRKV